MGTKITLLLHWNRKKKEQDTEKNIIHKATEKRIYGHIKKKIKPECQIKRLCAPSCSVIFVNLYTHGVKHSLRCSI